MMKTTANLYVIGGCNGAGKTTTAMKILPGALNCIEYVNADAIAVGLSPFNPESVVIQAGKLMIERLHILARSRVDFAFESTLASKMLVSFIDSCKKNGYVATLIYFWLNSPDLAVARVQDRVRRGGHSIPETVIRRRYEASRKNFINLYLPIADNVSVYDNSNAKPRLIYKRENKNISILNDELWKRLNA
jgi:predicted ABC-type ATPase